MGVKGAKQQRLAQKGEKGYQALVETGRPVYKGQKVGGGFGSKSEKKNGSGKKK